MRRSPYRIADGLPTLPSQPGLGVELDEEQVTAANELYHREGLLDMCLEPP
ncbi:hypothetical protein [Nocardia sp. CY41]|uniref:hypothetical protein n=1 Tax=Nocardia sp. CY41 TaxID=2608686 RepID=UPI00135AF204|nr:hypothetical protein [Nocardia sp. CY41]